ncbi:unnamed protein product [Closterium sp. Yama58-4]|nr:unnamed protein product [Closterium sp. Yama58-4]
MHSRLLVSGLPRSLPALPPSPAPPCIPCVEGRQRAAPHSSSFPPTEDPLQTLHMDVWGPARIQGQGRERYFLLVVDDYTRYTTVFPLRSKGDVPAILIPWIRAVCLQLRERFRSDFPVLRLHSDRGGEFTSDLLRAFCEEHGICQSFTLPASPQQNGVAERRIGLVMEVARTSMIHAAAPHFLWPFVVRYAAHQLNLWPRVSVPETSPTLRWTGEVGDASRFRVWGARAFVRDLTADKLSARVIPCVFLGFPTDAPGWQFYDPASRRVFASQDVTFDESVPFYRLFPYRTAPLPPPPPRRSFSLQVLLSLEVLSLSVRSLGVLSLRVRSQEVLSLGVWSEPEGAEPGGTESGGAAPGGTEAPGEQSPWSGRLRSRSAGASPQPSRRRVPFSTQQLREWYVSRQGRAARARGPAAGGAGVGGTGAGAVPLSPQQLREWYVSRHGRAAGAGASATGGVSADVTGAGGAGSGGAESERAERGGTLYTGATKAAGLGGARTGGTGAAGAGVLEVLELEVLELLEVLALEALELEVLELLEVLVLEVLALEVLELLEVLALEALELEVLELLEALELEALALEVLELLEVLALEALELEVLAAAHFAAACRQCDGSGAVGGACAGGAGAGGSS